MKNTIISCFITAAACIAFSIIFSVATRQKIEDHSQHFKELEAADERVRKNELITFEELQTLYRVFKDAQSRIDSLQSIVVLSSSKLSSYEKQLKDIRAGMKTTHYQDSSKAVIIKNLPN